MSQLDQFEVEVLVHGKPVQEYSHKGNYYIEGKEGTEFSLKFRNRSSKRALFVPTIDGLSVMDGKKASFKSSGYIVDAYSSETIDGWRMSDKEVAKFFFAKIAEAYAEQKGDGENVGVIGCAVFREREQHHPIIIHDTQYVPYPVYPKPWYPRWPWQDPAYYGTGVNMYSCQAGVASNQAHTNLVAMSTSNTMSVGSASSAQDQSASIGIGFGDTKYAPVSTVEFERATERPTAIFTTYYNTRERLVEMGVEFRRTVHVAPSAFPTEKEGYCKPPEGWRK